MKTLVAFRRWKIEQLTSALVRPDMHARSAGEIATVCELLLGDLRALDDRDEDDWRSASWPVTVGLRFGPLGQAELERWFEHTGQTREAASLYCEVAFALGYLACEHVLDEQDWASLDIDAADRLAARDWQMSDLRSELPQPSIDLLSTWCFAPPDGGRWVYLDFTTWPRADTDPQLRNIRLPYQRAVDGLVLTPVGRTLATTFVTGRRNA